MTKLLAVIVLVLSFNVSALELHGVKKTASTLNILTADSFNKAWNGAEPVCIKDGGKFLGGNKSYGAKFSGGKACSMSEASQRLAKVRGGSIVTVIRLAELPDSVIKELSKN